MNVMTAPERSLTSRLPEWDLSDLYAGPDSNEFKSDLTRAAAGARDFATRYEGRVERMALQKNAGAALVEAVREYEALQELIARIGSYASLIFAADSADPQIAKFYGDTQAKITDISTHLIFFVLEINRIDDAQLDKALKDTALAYYPPWLEVTRAFRPHQLEDRIEHVLHERSVSGASAWVRLFDESVSSLVYQVGDKALTGPEALHLLSDRDPAQRKAAADALIKTFSENTRLFGLALNTLMKDKETDDRQRRFATPMASRHLANQVEPEVVDALVRAVDDAMPFLSHRYYALKARWLGQKTLNFWDRNAPLPKADDRDIAWAEAQKIVLDAYRAFSPEMAEIGRRFFDKGWIDAEPRSGKAGGAFSHPTVPHVHPYILLNYMGKSRDVMTLAHELGHGVHQTLAAGQGMFLSQTPLTLAETASVFGEMLTFRAMLNAQRDKTLRAALIAGKVEDMLNTVVRQIAFYQFEQKLHEKRREGELTPGEIGATWIEVQRRSLGPAVEINPGYENFWCYVPHFVHTPFYVYAYAFGDCLVNSLYAVYEEQPKGFAGRYLNMLMAGGSKKHGELLQPFGLDARDANFWNRGLSLIGRYIDELERDAALLDPKA